MRALRLLIVALAGLVLSVTGLSAASATGGGQSGRPPQIGHLSSVAWSDDGVARVTGNYRCWGDSATMHLWVSLKQGGPDPTAEGSSTTVRAWYDTNISMDVAVKCDGRWHERTVTLGRHPVANYPTDAEGTEPTRPLGYLHHGQAWLQFCLVPPGAEQNPALLASKSRWVTVNPGHHGDDGHDGHDGDRR